jgi:hypothetical protein
VHRGKINVEGLRVRRNKAQNIFFPAAPDSARRFVRYPSFLGQRKNRRRLVSATPGLRLNTRDKTVAVEVFGLSAILCW